MLLRIVVTIVHHSCIDLAELRMLKSQFQKVTFLVHFWAQDFTLRNATRCQQREIIHSNWSFICLHFDLIQDVVAALASLVVSCYVLRIT